MEKRGCLYVGGDDSNHAGRTTAEIIVATFSYNPSDAIKKRIPRPRRIREIRRWLKRQGNDYRFSILAADKYRRSGDNLAVAIPDMIQAFIFESNMIPASLNISLDGYLSELSRRNIKEMFSIMGLETIVRIFPKGRIRRPYSTRMIYNADVLANFLYRNNTFEELSKNEKLYFIKQSSI